MCNCSIYFCLPLNIYQCILFVYASKWTTKLELEIRFCKFHCTDTFGPVLEIEHKCLTLTLNLRFISDEMSLFVLEIDNNVN